MPQKTKFRTKIPTYRQRKGYTQALVTLTDSETRLRRDFWLGEHGSPESREAYHRVIAAWEANDRRLPAAEEFAGKRPSSDGVTITEIVRDYWRWAESYCRPKLALMPETLISHRSNASQFFSISHACPQPSIASRHPCWYTEPYGSVFPLRCLVRRALGRHPTRRSGAARACGRFDHSPGRDVPHDPHGHEETCRGPGEGGARHNGEGRARADLQTRTARTGSRGGMDRKASPALGRALRRAGPSCRGIEPQGESKWKEVKKVKPLRWWSGSRT